MPGEVKEPSKADMPSANPWESNGIPDVVRSLWEESWRLSSSLESAAADLEADALNGGAQKDGRAWAEAGAATALREARREVQESSREVKRWKQRCEQQRDKMQNEVASLKAALQKSEKREKEAKERIFFADREVLRLSRHLQVFQSAGVSSSPLGAAARHQKDEGEEEHGLWAQDECGESHMELDGEGEGEGTSSGERVWGLKGGRGGADGRGGEEGIDSPSSPPLGRCRQSPRGPHGRSTDTSTEGEGGGDPAGAVGASSSSHEVQQEGERNESLVGVADCEDSIGRFSGERERSLASRRERERGKADLERENDELLQRVAELEHALETARKATPAHKESADGEQPRASSDQRNPEGGEEKAKECDGKPGVNVQRGGGFGDSSLPTSASLLASATTVESSTTQISQISGQRPPRAPSSLCVSVTDVCVGPDEPLLCSSAELTVEEVGVLCEIDREEEREKEKRGKGVDTQTQAEDWGGETRQSNAGASFSVCVGCSALEYEAEWLRKERRDERERIAELEKELDTLRSSHKNPLVNEMRGRVSDSLAGAAAERTALQEECREEVARQMQKASQTHKAEMDKLRESFEWERRKTETRLRAESERETEGLRWEVDRLRLESSRATEALEAEKERSERKVAEAVERTRADASLEVLAERRRRESLRVEHERETEKQMKEVDAAARRDWEERAVSAERQVEALRSEIAASRLHLRRETEVARREGEERLRQAREAGETEKQRLLESFKKEREVFEESFSRQMQQREAEAKSDMERVQREEEHAEAVRRMEERHDAEMLRLETRQTAERDAETQKLMEKIREGERELARLEIESSRRIEREVQKARDEREAKISLLALRRTHEGELRAVKAESVEREREAASALETRMKKAADVQKERADKMATENLNLRSQWASEVSRLEEEKVHLISDVRSLKAERESAREQNNHTGAELQESRKQLRETRLALDAVLLGEARRKENARPQITQTDAPFLLAAAVQTETRPLVETHCQTSPPLLNEIQTQTNPPPRAAARAIQTERLHHTATACQAGASAFCGFVSQRSQTAVRLQTEEWTQTVHTCTDAIAAFAPARAAEAETNSDAPPEAKVTPAPLTSQSAMQTEKPPSSSKFQETELQTGHQLSSYSVNNRPRVSFSPQTIEKAKTAQSVPSRRPAAVADRNLIHPSLRKYLHTSPTLNTLMLKETDSVGKAKPERTTTAGERQREGGGLSTMKDQRGPVIQRDNQMERRSPSSSVPPAEVQQKDRMRLQIEADLASLRRDVIDIVAAGQEGQVEGAVRMNGDGREEEEERTLGGRGVEKNRRGRGNVQKRPDSALSVEQEEGEEVEEEEENERKRQNPPAVPFSMSAPPHLLSLGVESLPEGTRAAFFSHLAAVGRERVSKGIDTEPLVAPQFGGETGDTRSEREGPQVPIRSRQVEKRGGGAGKKGRNKEAREHVNSRTKETGEDQPPIAKKRTQRTQSSSSSSTDRNRSSARRPVADPPNVMNKAAVLGDARALAAQFAESVPKGIEMNMNVVTEIPSPAKQAELRRRLLEQAAKMGAGGKGLGRQFVGGSADEGGGSESGRR
uniref:Uncharacterized protein n=1 Tax=Chromera velia CCMP2878 TaxID=1169474 RepID=A0A0G4G562_9ALVE|eukprot:Cvel_20331.t1-p1 / transcript=Cvel_20331.t1 / gene=Cvel_20331 / organism=Chromera_velia_CCMP2878 / gene_product=Uncharacterized abhydrolase domain-containing, putative / transcript_product=Uncharacterized abhydrolase domain-containing, putative / location=Cvel_scaffold1816:9762-19546(-) / protein_length=1578 / sequence_SO=supercontig / SO=protein_coding / is_pseudo=false